MSWNRNCSGIRRWFERKYLGLVSFGGLRVLVVNKVINSIVNDFIKGSEYIPRTGEQNERLCNDSGSHKQPD